MRQKNNTNIYVKAFESWVTRISIVVVVSALLTDVTVSTCFGHQGTNEKLHPH